MPFTIPPELEEEMWRAAARELERRFPPIKLPRRPWPSPSLLDWGRTVAHFCDETGGMVWWSPPDDARHFEHPASLMARHLAEAHWPEGVPR